MGLLIGENVKLVEDEKPTWRLWLALVVYYAFTLAMTVPLASLALSSPVLYPLIVLPAASLGLPVFLHLKFSKIKGADPKVGMLSETEMLAWMREVPPGIAHVLDHDYSGFTGIAGTILDLAEKDYINMKESEGKIILSKTNRPWENLARYEKKILEALFKKSGEVTPENMLNDFAYSIPEINRMIQEEAAARGYYKTPPYKSVREFLRKSVYSKASALIMAFGVLSLFIAPVFAPATGYLIILGVQMITIGAITASYTIAMAQKRVMKTQKGADHAKVIEQFKAWLKAHPIKNISMGTEYIDYLTAFKISDKYLKAFKPMQTIIVKEGTRGNSETTVITVDSRTERLNVMF